MKESQCFIEVTRYEIGNYPVIFAERDNLRLPGFYRSTSQKRMEHRNFCNAPIKRGYLILLVIGAGLFILNFKIDFFTKNLWEPVLVLPDQVPNKKHPDTLGTYRENNTKSSIYEYNTALSFNKRSPATPKYLYVKTNDTGYRDITDGKLLYNRIPKCGSTTVYRILQVLGNDEKRFIYSHSNVFSKKYLNLTEQEKFVKTFSRRKPPYGMDRHVYFVNFEKFGFYNPVYINMVRNPLDRLVSDYYFRRTKQNKAKSRFTKDEINMTLDNCVSSLGVGSCIGVDRNIYTKWFCGHQIDICSNPDSVTAQAKYNIDNIYALIGVTEFFQETLQLFETKIPLFFKGALDVFKRYGRKNVNKRKLDRPITSLQELTVWLKNDFEIYNFIRQKFFTELQEIKKFRQ